jgi:hypothetical protein
MDFTGFGEKTETGEPDPAEAAGREEPGQPGSGQG